MKDIRRNMLRGHWNAVCKRCLITELNGGVSRRNIENSKFVSLMDDLLTCTAQDGGTSFGFKSIDYRLGNLCNLQCRMCSPFSSTAWIGEWNEVKPKEDHISEELKRELSHYDWIKKDLLFEEFKLKLPEATHLHFAGGEPLIAPQMSKMLKFCVEKGYAKNLDLTYNTNITILPPNVLELWKEFKSVKLLCSIDGFEKVNDYIRDSL